MNKKEEITNLRFKLFLESKGIKEEEYLRNKNIVKNIEYMEFIDNYIASYHKIPGNEGTRVESNPEEFDDYLKFKVLGKCLEKIAYESIGTGEMESFYESRKLLEKYGITEENDKDKLYPRLKLCFELGIRKKVVDKYENFLEKIPDNLKDKYLPELSYNDRESSSENYSKLSHNISIVDNIEKIESNPFKVKVFINYSESSSYKGKEVYSIEEMQSKSFLALEEIKKEQKRLGHDGIYNKVDLTILIDSKEKIEVFFRGRFDVGDYKDFDEYLKETFIKDTYKYIQSIKNETLENCIEEQYDEEEEEDEL